MQDVNLGHITNAKLKFFHDIIKDINDYDKTDCLITMDAGCEPNPGPGAWAFIEWVPGLGTYVSHSCGKLDQTSSNVAEYTALLHAVDYCNYSNKKNIVIITDSMIVHHQMKGFMKVKAQNIINIKKTIDNKIVDAKFKSIRIKHVPRALNEDADLLVNLTIGRNIKSKLWWL